MTAPSWMDEKQAELTEMEWGWRALDEQEWRQAGNTTKQIARARRQKEADVSRLRAELAAASFVEEFYTTRQAAIGEALVPRADLESWADPHLTREDFARFVRAEVERMKRPGVKIQWGPPIQTRRGAEKNWWIDLEAVCLLHGREQTRQQYRFHVAGDRVDAWLALPDTERGF